MLGNSVIFTTLDLLSTLLIGLMVGSELCVAAFIHPILNTLEPYPHLSAATKIAATLGRIMPPWYGLNLVALLLELWVHSAQPVAFRLLFTATLLWSATILLTVGFLVPRNNRIARLDPHRPYANWRQDRDQWDSLHRIRVSVLTLVFGLVLLALLRPA